MLGLHRRLSFGRRLHEAPDLSQVDGMQDGTGIGPASSDLPCFFQYVKAVPAAAGVSCETVKT